MLAIVLQYRPTMTFPRAMIISDDQVTLSMEPILIAAILMVFLAVVVIFFMTYLGYDVRSRGFRTSGPAAATLPKLGITMGSYFRKKKEHPVTDEDAAKWAKVYLFLTFVSFFSFGALAIVLIFL